MKYMGAVYRNKEAAFPAKKYKEFILQTKKWEASSRSEPVGMNRNPSGLRACSLHLKEKKRKQRHDSEWNVAWTTTLFLEELTSSVAAQTKKKEKTVAWIQVDVQSRIQTRDTTNM
ncbi:uncharacterized protein LOC109844567 [Asparagus officinalis]|uniref:uncharacterized protein LOC109844567 n=1 Tax=Asparagus officinalis TaxID=4686 RepID=UPI00098E6B44|nr:uncharacterized protein LOC109844567 [Asparagus officinalis]